MVITESSVSPPPPGSGSAASFVWDFGDGTQAVTSAPIVSHDFFPSVNPGRRALAFDVQCTVVHDSVTVKRTLVLYSAYDISQKRGTTVPHSDSDTFATLTTDRSAFTAPITIYNIEAVPLWLTEMAWIPALDDPGAALAAPSFIAFESPICIASGAASVVGTRVASADLHAAVGSSQSARGIIFYFKGVLGPFTMLNEAATLPVGAIPEAGIALPPIVRPPHGLHYFLPVRMSRTVAIRLNDRQLIQRFSPIIKININVVSQFLGSFTHTIDSKTNTISVALSSRTPTPIQLAKARQAVTSGIQALSSGG